MSELQDNILQALASGPKTYKELASLVVKGGDRLSATASVRKSSKRLADAGKVKITGDRPVKVHLLEDDPVSLYQKYVAAFETDLYRPNAPSGHRYKWSADYLTTDKSGRMQLIQAKRERPLEPRRDEPDNYMQVEEIEWCLADIVARKPRSVYYVSNPFGKDLVSASQVLIYGYQLESKPPLWARMARHIIDHEHEFFERYFDPSVLNYDPKRGYGLHATAKKIVISGLPWRPGWSPDRRILENVKARAADRFDKTELSYAVGNLLGTEVTSRPLTEQEKSI